MSKLQIIIQKSAFGIFLLLIGVTFANAQIDWGRVLDLSPKNTETKPERLDLKKELELGQQIREQNQRSQPDYPGRQDNRSSPPIEIRGVFEHDKPDRSNDFDRSSGDRGSDTVNTPGKPQYQEQSIYRNTPPTRYGKVTLNNAEKMLYASHPELIPVVTYVRAEAEKETIRRFGINGEDDASDAFRHAYASSFLARSVGPEWASLITYVHEKSTTANPQSREMDLYNNEAGIRIGIRNPWATDKQIADMIERAARSGHLYRIY